MVTLHEVITFLVSMQISISSLQTHNVNRCGRSRHLARKLSLRRKRSSPNEIGRASCRERVEISVVGVSLKKKEGEGRLKISLKGSGEGMRGADATMAELAMR